MTMATPRGAMRAKSIGHYTLGKTIGEGTFGKVKLGTHVLTGEKVAVKILEKERIADVADVERVAREIKILKLVQHPHVIQLYEIIETPRQLYLIMEFCNGGELFDHIVQSGRVREAEACRFFHQILAGVEQIHRSGVVHRDLKPENLLLDHQQNIKIVDFGLSNTFQEGQLLKTACGSPCYAAPEMIAGHRYVPSRCDVWSCGVILFALVCGYLPFEDQNTAALYNKILSADYTAPKFISDGVRDLITRMLTTEPDFRVTIPRIRQHTWYRQIAEASKPFLANEKGELVLDQDVLEQMDRLDFPRNYTVKCLQMRKHNHATATYYLLAEKRSRAGGPAAKQAEFPSIGVEDLPNTGLTIAAISTPRGADADGQVMTGGVGLDAPPPPADADSAAGAAPAPQGIFGHEREPALFGLPPPHSARDAGSQSGSRRSLTPLQGQSGASPGAGRATPPAPAPPPPPLGDLQPGRARPRSQLQNYQAVYAGRGEQPATSRTTREPRHSAAATVASAARAGDREASGSRAGAAPRRYSEAPRATTPRIVPGDPRALVAGGRRTPNQTAPHIATPRRPGSQASGHTPRVSQGHSRPGGAGGAAAAYRSHTPSKGVEAGAGDQLPSARRANGRLEQDEMAEGESTRPPTSQGVHAPVRPSVPPPVRNGPQGMEARRRHYTSSSEAPTGRSQRAPSPTSGGASGSTSRAGASVATVDLFGGPRSARGAPAAAWGPALSERGATSRAVSATPDIAADRGANPASAREGRNDEAMRTCRGAFNVSCTSSKAPKQILQEMQRALHLQQVAFKQISPFLVKCQKHGLRFEMEVAHLDHLESIYVVRFRRVAGELAAYKELCSKILADMKI